MLGRDAQRDARVADLPLRPYEPLCERRLGDEERACDLRRRQSAEQVERERDLRIRGERGMAAREDQLEPLVGQRCLLVVRELLRTGEQLRLERERSLTPDAVDRTVPRRRDEPAGGVGGNAALRPAFDRDRQRVLKCVLGEVEVAEDADQGGENARALVADDLLEKRPYAFTSASRMTIGRTSMWP